MIYMYNIYIYFLYRFFHLQTVYAPGGVLEADK